MRSTSKDSGDKSKYITFSADVGDAASGSGLAQPGNIPFSFVRISTGVYNYTLLKDSLTIQAITCSINAANSNMSSVGNLAPTTFSIITMNNGPVANSRHSWTCTAFDEDR